jgi:hypothetical protein
MSNGGAGLNDVEARVVALEAHRRRSEVDSAALLAEIRSLRQDVTTSQEAIAKELVRLYGLIAANQRKWTRLSEDRAKKTRIKK